MAVALYLDHHVPRAVTHGLRLRDVDVITAYEDGQSTTEDSALLDRATDLQRALVTQDDDLLAEATARQQKGQRFAGVIYAHQLRISIGRFVHDLELIANASESADLADAVIYLPFGR